MSFADYRLYAGEITHQTVRRALSECYARVANGLVWVFSEENPGTGFREIQTAAELSVLGTDGRRWLEEAVAHAALAVVQCREHDVLSVLHGAVCRLEAALKDEGKRLGEGRTENGQHTA